MTNQNLKELEKYLKHEFSSGPITGSDYNSFQTKYINYLKSVCRENGWEFVRALKNHYEFSAFIKANEKFIYFSICDVRYFTNQWYTNILVRTAQHEKDYRGGRNTFTSLPELQPSIKLLLAGGGL